MIHHSVENSRVWKKRRNKLWDWGFSSLKGNTSWDCALPPPVQVFCRSTWCPDSLLTLKKQCDISICIYKVTSRLKHTSLGPCCHISVKKKKGGIKTCTMAAYKTIHFAGCKNGQPGRVVLMFIYEHPMYAHRCWSGFFVLCRAWSMHAHLVRSHPSSQPYLHNQISVGRDTGVTLTVWKLPLPGSSDTVW